MPDCHLYRYFTILPGILVGRSNPNNSDIGVEFYFRACLTFQLSLKYTLAFLSEWDWCGGSDVLLSPESEIPLRCELVRLRPLNRHIRPLSKVRIWVCVQDCRWQQSNWSRGKNVVTACDHASTGEKRSSVCHMFNRRECLQLDRLVLRSNFSLTPELIHQPMSELSPHPIC